MLKISLFGATSPDNYSSYPLDINIQASPIDIVGFPEEMSTGLYLLSIMTPHAAAISRVELRIKHKDHQIVLPTSMERKKSSINLYFAISFKMELLELTFYGDVSLLLRIEGADFQRISTTNWRLRQLRKKLIPKIVSPKTLLADISTAIHILKGGGVGELGNWFLGKISPGGDSIVLDANLKEFAQRIFIQNRAAIKLYQQSPTTVASLSIIVPVYLTPKQWIIDLIESVNTQTSQEFEIIFIFDGPQPNLEETARVAVGKAYRSSFFTLPLNMGVSCAINAGIKASNSDYIVVVDHDDVLEPHFVEAFHAAYSCEAADIFYADECITDALMSHVKSVASRGKFDIRYYLSHPYIVHPIFIRRIIAISAGFYDEKLRVSHDVDFFLRCLSVSVKIVQIPLVLYFWRTHEKSLGHLEQSQVTINTQRAAISFLKRTTNWPLCNVQPGINFNELQIHPPLPLNIKAAIIIPTKNGYELLSKCLNSIYDRNLDNITPADIFIVDHDSDDPDTLKLLIAEQMSGRVKLIRHSGPWNYAQINNLAVAKAKIHGQYTHFVFMNNDIEIVTRSWLDLMMQQFSWGDVGVTGCCLVYPDGRIQHGGVIVGMTDVADHSHRFEQSTQAVNGRRAPGYLSSLVSTRDYSAVTAALMIVPADLFYKIGGFDEQLPIGFNDTDICLKIGVLGLHSTYVGSVVAIHHESASRKETGQLDHIRDTETFRERYNPLIKDGDPYYGLQLNWDGTQIQMNSRPTKSFSLRVSYVHRQLDGLPTSYNP